MKYMCEPCGYIYDPAEGDPDGALRRLIEQNQSLLFRSGLFFYVSDRYRTHTNVHERIRTLQMYTIELKNYKSIQL